MSLIRKLLVKAGISERRNDGRFRTQGLFASCATGKRNKRIRIRDISLTGGYLLTRERWLPGAIIELTLERKVWTEPAAHDKVRLRAKSVRVGEDGVGVSLVPGFVDRAAWTNAVGKAATLAGENDIVGLFRDANALALLLHMCQSAESEILNLLTSSLSRARADGVIEVVLGAQNLLVASGIAPRTDVSPASVLRILQEASNAEEEVAQQCWAGMLASLAIGRCDENTVLEFAALLLHLPASQILILTEACTRAIEAGLQSGSTFSQTLTCSAAEIRKIVGAKNWVPIGGDLNHLYILGFLEKSDKPYSGGDIDRANITPTPLGMRFYMTCCAPAARPDAARSDNESRAGMESVA